MAVHLLTGLWGPGSPDCVHVSLVPPTVQKHAHYAVARCRSCVVYLPSWTFSAVAASVCFTVMFHTE